MKKIPALIFSRVSGYYTTTKGWNKGKQEEFSQRRKIKVPEVVLNEVSNKNIQMQEMRN